MNAIHRPRAIRIAILAMGGEGGGVLADWIVDMAENGGWLAQSTSVPGVAQRTGATIYYLELFPKSAIDPAGPQPVLALMPNPGDVDVVVCSELMEAGRAIQRGFVTPDRTVLVASTHRVFAMTEKIALADGRVEPAPLLEACGEAAKTLVAFDMDALARKSGSVISAVMFGALARSGALPFDRPAFEATIRRGGVGVEPSLRGFALGLLDQEDSPAPETARAEAPPSDLAALIAEAEANAPEAAKMIVREGALRTMDYQNLAYSRLYVARLQPILAIERTKGGPGTLFAETARQLALGMTYEDAIRVAGLKIRGERFARIRDEMEAAPDQIVEIAEFMHPRTQEIADILPAPLGRFLLRNSAARAVVDRFTRKGRTVKTTSLRGFLLLSLVAALKPLRPRSLRAQAERRALDDWLALVAETALSDYALAVEIAECRGLVKGYGDTHERGYAAYAAIAGAAAQLRSRPDAARIVAGLRKAATADDTGQALRAALAALDGEAAERRRLTA